MWRPLLSIFSSRDENERQLESGKEKWLPPDQLCSSAYRISGIKDEFLFLETELYEIVIDPIAEFIDGVDFNTNFMRWQNK